MRYLDIEIYADTDVFVIKMYPTPISDCNEEMGLLFI